MDLVVKKFGGTSVGNIERIHNVAAIIKRSLEEAPERRVIAVVSAMSGETNRLSELARSCVAEPDPRELDVLLATGEQVSVALLAMTLREMGIPAKSLLAQQARIGTTQSHTRAQILDIDRVHLQGLLDEAVVPVVAGFQGVDEKGDLTTLGRGGSDITAVAVAAAFNAAGCYIYTDVDGVYSCDPRMHSRAHRIERVCHEEMLEMASLGAKVLHPRSVYFAMRYQVPLKVLSSFDPEAGGTWIVREEELMEKPIVTGVTYRVDEARITVQGIPKGIHSLNTIFGTLAEREIFVDMITQTGVEGDTTNVSFTVPDEVSSDALRFVQDLVPQMEGTGASLERDIAKVSVVGVGMKYHTGVAAKMFNALASEGIDVQMIATSEIKISVVMQRKYCEMAVRTLHDAFIDMQPVISEEE